jgi:hypothetical protein
MTKSLLLEILVILFMAASATLPHHWHNAPAQLSCFVVAVGAVL